MRLSLFEVSFLAMRLRFVVVGFLSLLVLASSALANPNSADPTRNLAAHETIPGAKEMIGRLYEIYAKHEKTAIDLKSGSLKPERYPYKQLERAAGSSRVASMRNTGRTKNPSALPCPESNNPIGLPIQSTILRWQRWNHLA